MFLYVGHVDNAFYVVKTKDHTTFTAIVGSDKFPDELPEIRHDFDNQYAAFKWAVDEAIAISEISE